MNEMSGLVITLNESRNIVDCLRSMKQVCDNIAAVDSGRSDDTVELAKAEEATVIVQKPFPGDGPQCNHDLPYCRHQWILNLDADERLEDDFVQYVKRTNLDDPGVDLIQTRRRNYFIGDRFAPHVGQYPDYMKRLFRKNRARFIPVVAHTYVEAKSSISEPIHITHYSYRDYLDMVEKYKYADWRKIWQIVPTFVFLATIHAWFLVVSDSLCFKDRFSNWA